MASVGTYDNVITAGASSVTVTGIIGSPTAYTVYDGNGATIATGAMSGSSVSIAPSGGWPAGYALIVFTHAGWDGSTGHVTDALQLSVFRSGVATMPPVPAAGTAQNASDLNSHLYDQYLHAFTLMGPQRWQINDAASPTVFTAGAEQGATIAGIQANLTLDAGAAGYSNPTYADAARPRPEFVQFPTQQASESGYAAGVTATVQALGPGTSYGVQFFEGLNEPQGEKGLSPAQSAAQYNAFRAAVHAGHANAKAIGPCEVAFAPDTSSFNPTMSQLDTWLGAVTAGTLDAFSVHDYNAYNGDFLATDAWLGGARAKLAAHGYPSDLPFFLTENSVGPAWQVFDSLRIVQWAAQLYLTAERWNIPKEHIYWFFDQFYGFGFPNWIKETTGDLRPMATFFRVYSEEVFGKAYTAALDFGTIANAFYRGNVYRGSAGTLVALTAQGFPVDTCTLSISDTGTVTYVDWQGHTSTATVTGGKVTIPIGATPTYVRLTAGCTVSAADVGNGLAGSPSNIAPAATVTSSTGSSNTTLVNNNVFETGGYLAGPDVMYRSARLPDALTLTWSTPQPIGKVLIRQAAPWTNFDQHAAMIRGKLEYWNGSGWIGLPTVPGNHWDDRGRYVNTTATGFLGQVGGKSNFISFYDQNWCHNVDLKAPIKTTKIRWTVTEAGFGQVPSLDAAEFALIPVAGVATDFPRLLCSEIIVVPATIPSTCFMG
jgi:hypothetical protein